MYLLIILLEPPQIALSAAWASDTTRTDAIALQDGIPVKSGTATLRWVGTIRTTGTTTTEDSGGGVTTQVGGKRFVWNAYNQVPRALAVIDTTDNWTYTTATVRQANGATGNKVEYVAGSVASFIEAMTMHHNHSRVSTMASGLLMVVWAWIASRPIQGCVGCFRKRLDQPPSATSSGNIRGIQDWGITTSHGWKRAPALVRRHGAAMTGPIRKRDSLRRFRTNDY